MGNRFLKLLEVVGKRLIRQLVQIPGGKLEDAYLGLASAGFPNALFSYGPQSPAAFCNGPTSAEMQGDALADLLDYLRANGNTRVESTTAADTAWSEEIAVMLSASLFDQADSWYLGANIPGKPRVFMLFIGGFAAYNDICAEIADAGYKGFNLIKTRS